MSNIYTYVVDHGKESPAVVAATEINGGKLKGIMFDDALARLEKVEKFLIDLRDDTTCQQTRYSIDDFVNQGQYENSSHNSHASMRMGDKH